MPKNRVKVSIMDAEYIVLSDEDESYVIETAAEIEKKIMTIINSNSRISMLMATTLTAMDYCDIAKKSNLASDNLRSQIKDYLEESSKSRAQLEESKKEIAKLNREIQTLKMRLSEQQKPQNMRNFKPNIQTDENPNGRQVTTPAPISRPVKGKVTPSPVNGASKVTKLGKADDEIMDFFDQNNKR